MKSKVQFFLAIGVLILTSFFIIFVVVVQVQLSPFSVQPFPTRSSHPHFPPLILPPLALSVCPLCMFLTTIPLSLLTTPPTSPLVTVSLFLISMSIVIFCLVVLFSWWGPTYRWDVMVFVFHSLAYFTYYDALQFHPCCHKG